MPPSGPARPRRRPRLSPREFARLKRVRAIARLLDNAIELPVIRYRVGLDPLLGLLPVGGDVLGFLFSIYLIFESARFGASEALIAQMAGNVVFDSLLGMVPVAGDLADVAWKANAANLELLETHLEAPPEERRVPWAFLIGALLLLALIFGTLLWASLWVLRQVVQALGLA